MGGNVISGRLTFDDTEPFENATVWVILEDVTHADGLSREVSRLKISGHSHASGSPPLEFSLAHDPLDPTHRYEIRAHVDRTSTGRLKPGDQTTMQSYPVVTQGYPNRVQAQLRRID
jgi:uncharacterized lipoprotein YbaY